ncbi:MAG: ArsR family transcriptional regulator [Deltaproteobacteria bacterium]|nr:ArsR family transcriptional regulator [Deltaproteobacteria bacterium]
MLQRVIDAMYLIDEGLRSLEPAERVAVMDFLRTLDMLPRVERPPEHPSAPEPSEPSVDVDAVATKLVAEQRATFQDAKALVASLARPGTAADAVLRQARAQLPTAKERKLAKRETPNATEAAGMEKVLELLVNRGPMKNADICAALGVEQTTVSYRLRQLMRQGRVRALDGHRYGVGSS